jgi:hypothetical protein
LGRLAPEIAAISRFGTIFLGVRSLRWLTSAAPMLQVGRLKGGPVDRTLVHDRASRGNYGAEAGSRRRHHHSKFLATSDQECWLRCLASRSVSGTRPNEAIYFEARPPTATEYGSEW